MTSLLLTQARGTLVWNNPGVGEGSLIFSPSTSEISRTNQHAFSFVKVQPMDLGRPCSETQLT